MRANQASHDSQQTTYGTAEKKENEISHQFAADTHTFGSPSLNFNMAIFTDNDDSNSWTLTHGAGILEDEMLLVEMEHL